MSSFADRDIRQRDILPAELLQRPIYIVIGVGAIGRQIALQLATMGVSQLVLIDPDTVGVENLGAQGFDEADVGKLKVEAVAEACHRRNSEVQIETYAEAFSHQRILPEGQRVTFCCVDSMRARRQIQRVMIQRSSFFIDTRMAAEVARVVCAQLTDSDSVKYYQQTLFDDADAHRGSCTAKTTFYCASFCASLAVAQFTKWLRRMPVEYDTLFNLRSGEVVHQDELAAAAAAE